ncbi:unnamed protein product [Parajaminaea phylloscopi]
MAPRRQQQPQATSRFASRGAFDLLASDDIDDGASSDAASDNEVEPTSTDVPTPPQNISKDAGNATPAAAKLTRTQQKKLAKEARDAKKGQASQPQQADQSSSATQSAQASVGLAEADVSSFGQAPSSVPSEGAAAEIAQAAKGPAAQREQTPSLVQEEAAPVSGSAVEKPAQPAAAAAPVAAEKPQAEKTPVVHAPATTHSHVNGGASVARTAHKAPATVAPRDGTADAEKRAAERTAYWKKIQERTTFTFVMIFGFVGLLCLGHPYMIILVLVIQVLVYREVTALFEIPGRPSITGGGTRRHVLSRHNSLNGNVGRVSKRYPAAESAQVSEDEEDYREEERKELLWSKTLSWYFFTVANYFLYGESLIYYFKHIVFVDSYFIPFARHHRFLSFLLYVIGFVGFVSGLRRENLKHQFGLFGWVHMSLLLIVFSSHFLVNNILEGLIWFFVPASLVICNDVFAYVCGMIWGRTPLISLSPKKTVEGFVGALVITEVFAFGWATYFQRFNYLVCPAVSLGMNAFQDIQCQPNHVFQWSAMPLPVSVSDAVSAVLHTRVDSIPYTPFQLHSLVMAAFASLVAPFGGFFASGFKRAFNIKDFGDSIPGHGGLTDRFDCQFLMGLFSYVYYSSLIREHHVTVGSILQLVVTHLGEKEQVETYREIGRFLAARGVRV